MLEKNSKKNHPKHTDDGVNVVIKMHGPHDLGSNEDDVSSECAKRGV